MIGQYQDILTIEQAAQPNAALANTYELLQQSAQQFGPEPALSFFFHDDDHHQPHR